MSVTTASKTSMQQQDMQIFESYKNSIDEAERSFLTPQQSSQRFFFHQIFAALASLQQKTAHQAKSFITSVCSLPKTACASLLHLCPWTVSPPLFDQIIDFLFLTKGLSLSQKNHLLSLYQTNPDEAITAAVSFSPIIPFSENQKPYGLLLSAANTFIIKKLIDSKHTLSIISPEDFTKLSTISSQEVSVTKHTENYVFLKKLYAKVHLMEYLHNIQKYLRTNASLTHCEEAIRSDRFDEFTTALAAYVAPIAKTPPSPISCYAQELIDALPVIFSFENLSTELLRQEAISRLSHTLRTLKKTASSCMKLVGGREMLSQTLTPFLQSKTFSSETFLALRPVICPTFTASQIGYTHRLFQKLRCMIEAKQPPKNLLFLTCSCGGGHNRMTESVKAALEFYKIQLPYDICHTTIDVPSKIFRQVDTVHTYTGKDTTWLYNFFLRKDFCFILELLKKSGGTPSPELSSLKQTLLRRSFLQYGPDMLNMVYTFDGNDIDTVAEQLGLPLLHVTTDLDLSGWSIPPKSSLFTFAVASINDPIMSKTLNQGHRVIKELGLSIGPKNEQHLSASSHEEIRQQVYRRYGIPDDTKLVFISSGRYAIQNKIPDIIAKNFSSTAIKLHVIVACGENKKYKTYLEQKVFPEIRHKDIVSMMALNFIPFEEAVHLMRACDTFIGKPGGMTCMDLWKIRSGRADPGIIFDETGYRFSWELLNAEVLQKRLQAKILKKDSDVCTLLSTPINRAPAAPDPIAEKEASKEYVHIVTDLLQQADHTLHKTTGSATMRQVKKSWYSLAKKMGEIHSTDS